MTIINNGKGSQPKTKRNRDLIADYELVKKGELKMANLIGKYEISGNRIKEILKNNGVELIKK